jgi:uncharacterized protein (TIGR02996 family)
MASHPVAYAPTAAEVLTPDLVPPPVVVMAPDERRLMDAILSAPDADEPRLRFADWVGASDPERAAFIRAQINALPRGEDERVRERWLAPFLPFGARDIVFRRGFVEGMSLTGRSFISLSDGLFVATPLREVRLIAVNFLLAELAACQNLQKLTRLDLRGNRIDADGLALLAGCQRLAGVEVLV